ncbi:Peptidase M12A and CUB domain containing protein [Aphelenchoides bicaudatus]|nr:Peptidase M12A and CUB domain containing protein [Aphelenchoides bicaudatus]
MRMNCALNSTILLIITYLLINQVSLAARTEKASKSALKQIQQLINKEVERTLPQSDYNQPPPFTRNPNAKHPPNELDVNDPNEFFQGDVYLSTKQAKILLKQLATTVSDSSEKHRTKRKVGREKIYKRWDRQRPISFDFDQTIPSTTRQTIREALGIWEKYTCIRFQEGGPEIDRLEFYDGGGCSSFVGRAGGTQGISIATPGCDSTGVIAHEVGHALGLFHEQARTDQDQNVNIHYGNIPVTRWNNFYPVGNEQAEIFGLPYDAGSVMHYNAYGFATNPNHPTITTIDKHFQATIGQRGGPSFLDIQAINIAYKCMDNCRKKLKCKNHGYTHPNDCSSCLCPMGLSGPLCTEVQNSACGAKIQASTNNIFIETPFYPLNFQEKLDCYWLIEAPKGGKVYLEFVDEFDYECSDPCDSSFVEVKTKLDFRPVGYRICCSTRPDKTFVSEGSQLIIMHRSFGTISHGFRAKIWSDMDQSIFTLPPILTTTSVSTSNANIISTTQETTTDLPEFGTLPGELPVTSTPDIDSNEIEFPESFTLFPTLPTLSPTSTQISTTTTDSVECACSNWSEWVGNCTQPCGGCGKRTRLRACRSDNCRKQEKRGCNFEVCPSNINFLFNNNEFHFLFNGCCVGLFERNGQCGGLDTKEDPFLQLFLNFLRPEDSKNSTRRVPLPD